MEDSILGLPDQFNFEPKIIKKENLCTNYEKIVLVGMGGSHFCGGVLKAINPSLPIFIHRGYGIPEVFTSSKERTLFVFVSYSGNTEETIDSFKTIKERGLNTAVITTGGKLKDLAEETESPMIQIPDTGIQPRNAIGYLTLSLATILGDAVSVEDLKEMSFKLDPKKERLKIQETVKDLVNYVPIIYSSLSNKVIPYNWKIKFNETTKIPAFYNVFPELNHNEMEGFGVIESTKSLSSFMIVIFLMDIDDNPRIRKRMETTKNIYEERGIKTLLFELEGENKTEKIFRSLLTVDWLAFELAVSHYETDCDNVPVVEKFKKIIK